MKRISIFLLALSVSIGSLAQNREKRQVDTFNKISFSVPGKLYLKQGSTFSVELEGDKEVLEKIETEVEGGRLKIRYKDEFRWFNWRDWDGEKIIAYVTMKEVEAISVSGSGDLVTETKITAGDLDLKVSGSGTLRAEIDAQDVQADVSGSGDLELKGRLKNLESDVSGSGKLIATGTIAGTANFGISGSGRIMASGTAQEVVAKVSGSGKVQASNLETDKCEVRISGSGDVEINVKSSLDATISGSGSVSYKGSPSHVNSHASGSGKLRKL